MEVKTKFQRSFLIFENEDSGYEAGQKPTGYVKIEARDGKGRLWASAQYLKPLREGLFYELYLLRTGAPGFAIGRAGLLEGGNNGFSIDLEFDPSNFAGSGIRIMEIDTAVILVKSKDRPSGSVICPLAAYKNSKTGWRVKLADSLFKSSPITVRPTEKTDSYPVKLESKFKPRESEASFNIHEASFQKFYETTMPDTGINQQEREQGVIKESPPAVDTGYPGSLSQTEESGVLEQLWVQSENDESTGNVERKYQEGKYQEGKYQEGKYQEEGYQEGGYQEGGYQEEGYQEEGYQEEENGEEGDRPLEMPQSGEQPNIGEEEIQEGPSGDNGNSREYTPPAYEQINTGCMYMNGNLCGMRINKGDGNPCAGCRTYNASIEQEKKEKNTGDINQLKELLNRSFEKCDPFNSQRSDYMWWKVANPVNLNNMLYECGIRSPLLFNPAVMMSHYKYRHLIIGVYVDRLQRQEYLVCGVPGMHMVDKRPFNDMCRWVQMEGNKPVYGAFGYWLVYIEPRTGKLLNIR